MLDWRRGSFFTVDVVAERYATVQIISKLKARSWVRVSSTKHVGVWVSKCNRVLEVGDIVSFCRGVARKCMSNRAELNWVRHIEAQTEIYAKPNDGHDGASCVRRGLGFFIRSLQTFLQSDIDWPSPGRHYVKVSLLRHLTAVV